jgi:hypothetical protein
LPRRLSKSLSSHKIIFVRGSEQEEEEENIDHFHRRDHFYGNKKYFEAFINKFLDLPVIFHKSEPNVIIAKRIIKIKIITQKYFYYSILKQPAYLF